MSAKDLGDILFQVIWYYLRWSTTNANIPGIKKVVTTTNNDELIEKCKKRLLSICENRLKVLSNAPSWHDTLKTIMSNIK